MVQTCQNFLSTIRIYAKMFGNFDFKNDSLIDRQLIT